jgi:hypothetical protein
MRNAKIFRTDGLEKAGLQSRRRRIVKGGFSRWGNLDRNTCCPVGTSINNTASPQ